MARALLAPRLPPAALITALYCLPGSSRICSNGRDPICLVTLCSSSPAAARDAGRPWCLGTPGRLRIPAAHHGRGPLERWVLESLLASFKLAMLRAVVAVLPVMACRATSLSCARPRISRSSLCVPAGAVPLYNVSYARHGPHRSVRPELGPSDFRRHPAHVGHVRTALLWEAVSAPCVSGNCLPPPGQWMGLEESRRPAVPPPACSACLRSLALPCWHGPGKDWCALRARESGPLLPDSLATAFTRYLTRSHRSWP